MPPRRATSQVAKIGKFALATVPGALAPWQDKITSVELVSAYYQPNIAIVASILSVFSGIFMLAASERAPHVARVRRLGWSTGVLLMSVIACYFFHITIDKTWVPPGEYIWLIKLIWLGAYLLAMIALGAVVAVSVSVFGAP
jgi:hypothetical protein